MNKFLKEGLGYTPEKAREILNDFMKELEQYKEKAQMLSNTVYGITVLELIQDSSKIETIHESVSSYYNSFSHACNETEDFSDMLYDQYDETKDQSVRALYKEAEEVESMYKQVYKKLSKLDDITLSLTSYSDKFID